MKQQDKQLKVKKPTLAYAGFLFQTFFRRPFGYIIPCLYVVYLAVILIIVPKVLRFSPLFIWNVGGFNMPVFNLFFIAASSAALAVSVFRTGREDGTELSLSSKPLTKGSMVAMKVLVYLIIMCAFCLIANIVTALIQPCFGWYDTVFNKTGITQKQYVGINISVLIGNLVNMVLFGGISVLISMVGGQVITMVGSIGIVFVMCLMNFLFPQIVTSSLEVLKNKYDAEILSYSANTLDQYRKGDSSGQKKMSTILCSVDQEGEELQHFDTNEYWLKAEKESGGKATNYIDIARQLSSLFNSYGLDDEKLKEASKLAIGMNRGYQYKIDPSTHVALQENIDEERYPIAFYGMTTSQGFQYPQVIMLSADMTMTKNNWLLLTVINGYEFDSCSVLTNGYDSKLCDKLVEKEFTNTFYKIFNLTVNNEQRAAADNLYDLMLQQMIYDYENNPSLFNQSDYFENRALEIISADTSGKLFEGEYVKLTPQHQHKVVSSVHLAWAVKAQERQKTQIKSYIGVDDSFPFKSKTVLKWYKNKIENKHTEQAMEYLFGNYIFNKSIQVRAVPEEFEGEWVKAFDRLVTSKLNYAETYSNLYVYHVSNFYSIKTIVTVWSIVAVIFFAGSIVIYKKIDLK